MEPIQAFPEFRQLFEAEIRAEGHLLSGFGAKRTFQGISPTIVPRLDGWRKSKIRQIGFK
jgi:hypothetical protein